MRPHVSQESDLRTLREMFQLVLGSPQARPVAKTVEALRITADSFPDRRKPGGTAPRARCATPRRPSYEVSEAVRTRNDDRPGREDYGRE